MLETREAIGTYIDRYYCRPQSSHGYRTPKEVRKTWEDAQAQDAEPSTKSSGLR